MAQERLHVAASVGDQVDENRVGDSAINDAIGWLYDLPVLASADCIEFLRDRAALRKFCQFPDFLDENIDQSVSLVDRNRLCDVTMDIVKVAVGRWRQ